MRQTRNIPLVVVCDNEDGDSVYRVGEQILGDADLLQLRLNGFSITILSFRDPDDSIEDNYGFSKN